MKESPADGQKENQKQSEDSLKFDVTLGKEDTKDNQLSLLQVSQDEGIV